MSFISSKVRGGFAAVLIALVPSLVHADFTGYLKIPDIPGESERVDHEDEIEIYGIEWSITVPEADDGSVRPRFSPDVGPLKVILSMDKSSPYLALASMQGKSFPDVVMTARKDSGDAHLDYLKITMTNVVIVSYSMKTMEGSDVPVVEASFKFEEITYKYVEQNDDHSAGDEHEITYDIAAGV